MPNIAHYCPAFLTIKQVRVFDYKTSQTLSVSHPAIVGLLLELSGDANIWEGYDKGGFAAPEIAQQWRFTFGDKDVRQIDVTVEGETAYLYIFESNIPFADKNGNHFAPHPKRAVKVPLWQIETIINAMRLVIGADRYPSIADDMDKRWKRYKVAPKNGKGVNVRIIPATEGNDPVAILIGEPICFVITNAYQDWAQIKYQGSTYWISGSLIILTPQ